MLECYFDGACEPINPGGNIAWAFVVYEDGERRFEKSGFIEAKETNSNNVAEYMALLALLIHLKSIDAQDQEILIRGDSKMVINQMWGTWNVNKGHYLPYADKCEKLRIEFEDLTGEWVPREQNSYADSLTEKEVRSRNIAMFRDRR